MKKPSSVTIRPVVEDDLPLIFELQQDVDSVHMSGVNPRDADAFEQYWKETFADPEIVTMAIVADGEMVGHALCFRVNELDMVGYWIGQEHWGRGIATAALELLLEEVPTRPLHATCSRSNAGSVRVLKKCGFVLLGYEWAEARGRYSAGELARFRLG
jgi:RimJ/RimL family protein N-acetyltransferase